MIHGWPETKHSWRHQLPALSAAGYRAVAVDCRGYGNSTKPTDVAAYGIEAVVGDVIGVIEVLQLERPVLAGHDWGSILVWSAAVMHPVSVRAVASLNVPYRGWASGFPPTDFIREHLADRFGYVLYFQEVGKAEAAFAEDPDGWLRRVYYSMAKDPTFLPDEDFAVYRDAFVAGGMYGPLGYYRNIDANHALLASYENAPIEVPVLMIAADSDPVLPARLADGMDRWVADLTVAEIADAGHWVQQEQPDRVNEAMLDWLAALP